jgi:uncharacterized membrane protein
MRFSLTDRFSLPEVLPCTLPSLVCAGGPASATGVFFATPGGYPPPGDPGYSQPGYTQAGYTQPPVGYVPPPPPAGQPGLSVNSASALCYVLGLITGVIFLILEPYKRNPTVRFHAFQSIFLNVAVIVFWGAWGLVSGLLTLVSHGLFVFVAVLINLSLSLVFLILWIVLLIRAAQGQKWVLPVVGPLAEKQASTGAL